MPEIFCLGNAYIKNITNPVSWQAHHLNVIALEDAEAVTTDGFNWSLYVLDLFDITADPEDFTYIDNPHIRLGTWRKTDAPGRAPALPGYHYLEIQHKGERLLETIRHYAGDVPFEFRDCYELRLLDKGTGQPLALIDSARRDGDIYDRDLLT
jgi:hypothetical protein